MRYLILVINIIVCAGVGDAATYYVRTDGGTSTQCTGQAGLNVLTSEPSRRVIGKVRAEDARIISGGMQFRVRQQ